MLTGSVFQTIWLTNDTPNSFCGTQSFFFFLNYQTMTELNSLQSPRKFDFSRYMIFRRRQRTFSTLFSSNACQHCERICWPRSFAKWEARIWFTYFYIPSQTHILMFCQSLADLITLSRVHVKRFQQHLGFRFSRDHCTWHHNSLVEDFRRIDILARLRVLKLLKVLANVHEWQAPC